MKLFRNAALALLALVAVDARGVTIAWTPVGNPGNVADPATGSLYGSVNYNYKIGTYDVANSQYVDFLNAKDPTGSNPLSLFNRDSQGDLTNAGISFNAFGPLGDKYNPIAGHENQPVIYVSWLSAVRFSNWMNNGQGNSDTETGAYTIGALIPGSGGLPFNPDGIVRNAAATIVLPNENEWCKAAYYDTTTHSYFQYATSSNTPPTATAPPGSSNSANWNNAAAGHLTNVGAYTSSSSPSGTFDQSGNVWQYTEGIFSGNARVIRGGSFGNDQVVTLSSLQRDAVDTSEEGHNNYGFRVASLVPEPSSLVLAALGFAALIAWRLRRR